MKLHIKYFNLLILTASLLLVSGCNEFLEEEDPSNIAPETFFATLSDAQAAVDGIYQDMRFPSEGAGIFSANFQMLEAFSGTAETETGQNSDLNNLYSFQYTGDNLHLSQWWRQLYEGVANANLAIDRIPTVPAIKDEDLTRLVGHAKFLRAYYYFYLVRLWGGVPLLTKPIYTFQDPNINPSRASQEDVYNLIVEDLLAAESAGFPWTDETGRASLSAVKSLLARVYLTMAGYPLNRGTEYYQKAADKAKEVIDYATENPDKIGLFPEYADLRNIGNENKREHIFMIQYAAGDANADYQTFFLPNNTNITASGEVGTTVPTENFISSFESGDKRVMEKQFFFTSYFLDGGTGAPTTLNRPYVFKHFDLVANGAPGASGSGQSGLNYPLIRYADVLLMYAEAQNEVSGPTTETREALKAVRDRATLATPDVGDFDQTSFREAVWRERWHELCFEGITYFDMLRLRKIYVDTDDSFVDFVGGRLSTGVTLEEKHLLLPLPAQDYRNNPSLQGNNNPGW